MRVTELAAQNAVGLPTPAEQGVLRRADALDHIAEHNCIDGTTPFLGFGQDECRLYCGTVIQQVHLRDALHAEFGQVRDVKRLVVQHR